MTRDRRTDSAMVDEVVEPVWFGLPDYTDEILELTARTRQRPAWSFAGRWLPAGLLPMQPVLRFAVVVVLLAGALGGTFVVGAALGWFDSPPPQPPPPLVDSPAPTTPPTEPPAGRYDACAEAAASPIQLRVWDREGTAEISVAIDELIDDFEAANPGVTVVRETKLDGDLAAGVLAGLADPDGPDVVEIGSGREAMGTAIRANLLASLEDAAAGYGWTDRWAPQILARSRFGDGGRTWGSGELYGVPLTGEFGGLFFNLALGSQRPYGVNVQVLADHLDDFEVIRAAGHQPVVFGAADGDAVVLYGSLVQAMSEPGWMDELVFRGASFATPETVAAAEMLVEMAERGDLGEDWATLTHTGALERFSEGGGEFLWSGSWDARALAAFGRTFAADLLFTPVAPAVAGTGPQGVGGGGMPWAVRRSSPNAACAAALLDSLTTDRAAQVLAMIGTLPSHYAFGAPPSTAEFGSDSFQEMATAFRAASAGGRLGHRLETLYPGAGERIAAELDRLLAGGITAEELVATIEAEHRAYLDGLE